MGFDRFPDLEIYIKDTKPEQIVEWLEKELGPLSETAGKQNNERVKNLSLDSMNLLIIHKNGGARFTSVLLEPNESSWNTDQDFARAAFAHFNKETRASIGAWSNDDAIVDTYWRISKHGEGEFEWETQDPDQQ